MRNTADITSNRHNGNTESVAAHKSVTNSQRVSQRNEVLAAITNAPDGMTMKELAIRWSCQLNTISGRASELKKLGLIVKSGIVRNGSAVLIPAKKMFHTEPSHLPNNGIAKPVTFHVGESDPFEHLRIAHDRDERVQ